MHVCKMAIADVDLSWSRPPARLVSFLVLVLVCFFMSPTSNLVSVCVRLLVGCIKAIAARPVVDVAATA